MLFGVQDLVLDAHLLELLGELLGFLDGDRADQHGLSAFVVLLELLRRVAPLLFFGPVHHVLKLKTLHRTIGRDHDDVESVDLASVSAVPVMPASLSYIRK